MSYYKERSSFFLSYVLIAEILNNLSALINILKIVLENTLLQSYHQGWDSDKYIFAGLETRIPIFLLFATSVTIGALQIWRCLCPLDHINPPGWEVLLSDESTFL